MAQARESQAGLFDEALGLGGIGQAGVTLIDLNSSSTPPSMPSSASTLIPLAWARSATRFVIATFWSSGSWKHQSHRAVEARVNAIVTSVFVAVVEVHRENYIRKISLAERIRLRSIRLSVYFRAPFEIWMMNAPGWRGSHYRSASEDLPGCNFRGAPRPRRRRHLLRLH